MKTSKIIFSSILGTIAILILAAMIDVRLNGRPDSERWADFKKEKKDLQSFSVLNLNNSRNITLEHNDSSFIEVTFLKDSIAPKVNYKIEGNTLTVTDFEQIHRNTSITIHFTDSLQVIQLKESDISIEHLGSRKLSLDMDQSEVNLNQVSGDKSSIPVLDIVARNHSRINSSEFRIDSLGLVLQNSEANLEIIAKKISGTLSDSASIHIRQPEEISLKKDATSRINVNDY